MQTIAFRLLEALGVFSAMFPTQRGWRPARLTQPPKATPPQRLEDESFDDYRARRADSAEPVPLLMRPTVAAESTLKRRKLIREIGKRQFMRHHRAARKVAS